MNPPTTSTNIASSDEHYHQSPTGNMSSPFQCNSFVEDDCCVYGADRHAAATLRGFTARSNDEESEKRKFKPSMRTLNVKARPNDLTMKRIYKKRKATHTVRKEEMARLELEVTKLQKELEIMKLKTLMINGEETQSHRKKKAKSAVLREAVMEQHLKLAKIQSMLGEYSQQSLYRLYPTEMKIRLGTDRDARMKTLGNLRGPKLYEARMFLMERTGGLNLRAPYYQEERYENLDGDSCTVRFDVTPFRGAKSVEEVFAALQQAVFNAEIIISESSGNVTIREDDELGDKNLSHMRFVSQTPLGVEVETNLVLFSDFVQCQSQSECITENNQRYAIMASDYVDEDTKYPYKPNERIRRDSTSVTMVTSYRDSTASVKHGDEGKLVVVVTRWALNIMRRPTISISSGVWDSLCNSRLRWSDLMFNCARQALGLPAV